MDISPGTEQLAEPGRWMLLCSIKVFSICMAPISKEEKEKSQFEIAMICSKLRLRLFREPGTCCFALQIRCRLISDQV